nr:DUF2285 domain-containing protein [Mesorhizobium sp.]
MRQCPLSRWRTARRLFASKICSPVAIRSSGPRRVARVHREIVEALIDEGLIQANLRDPGGHLRDRARRAVSRSHALMNSGYRDFLV